MGSHTQPTGGKWQVQGRWGESQDLQRIHVNHYTVSKCVKPALPVLNAQWSETDIYTPVQETLTGDERHEFGHWTVGTIDIGTDPSEPTLT